MENREAGAKSIIASAGVSRPSQIALVMLICMTALLMGYTAYHCFQQAGTNINSYDGSYNAMVARDLAFQGRYGVWDNGKFVSCPVEVTTGPTMLLPTAAAYQWYGDSPFLANYVAAILCFSSLPFVWILAMGYARPRPTWYVFSLLVALVILFTITTKIWDLALWRSSLGEVLAGLFLLMATLSLGNVFQGRSARFWGALSGILAASAFNTKFIVILPLSALGIFLLISVFFRWIPRVCLVSWLLASAATEFCFDLFTFVQLGSFPAYLDHCKEFWRHFRAAGSGLGTSKPPLAQLVSGHSDIFFGELGWSGWLFLIMLLPTFFYAYELMRRRVSCYRWLGLACAVQIIPLLGWWFGYTSLMAYRHLVPVMVLLPFCFHFFISDVANRVRSAAGWAAIVAFWPGLVILSCALSPPGAWQLPSRTLPIDDRTAALLEFGQEVEHLRKEHPDARFWGAGWWRHWDVQLVTHVSCLNLLNPPPGISPGKGAHDYLIESDMFNAEHNPQVEAILRQNQDHLILSRRVFHLYQLKLPFLDRAVPSASHVNRGISIDSLAALNDGLKPSCSSDNSIPRFTWWNHCGTLDWVQYDFTEPATVEGVKVYWFDDAGRGACRVPQSWHLLYRDGTEWIPVENTTKYGTEPDTFHVVTFKKVKTTALRLVVQLQPGFSGGIMEWDVLETSPKKTGKSSF